MCIFRSCVLLAFVGLVAGCGGDELDNSVVGPSSDTASYRTLPGGEDDSATSDGVNNGTVIYDDGRRFRGATPLDQLRNPLADLAVTQQPGEGGSQGGNGEIEPTEILDPFGAGEGDGSGIDPTHVEDAAGNPIDNPIDAAAGDDSSNDVSHNNAGADDGDSDDNLEPTSVLDDDDDGDGGNSSGGNDSGENQSGDDDDDDLWADSVDD